MNNSEKVLAYLISILPDGATNSQIRQATTVEPHQQVFQITQKLLKSGQIEGRKIDGEWRFFARKQQFSRETPPRWNKPTVEGAMNAASFERLARSVLSQHYAVSLSPRALPGVPKTFDLVSPDSAIVGEAKYYTLVHGTALPPAKFATIAEHVWLLEKTNAREKFLVFGNQRQVPALWLEKHRHLCKGIKFYFLSDQGDLEEL